VSVQAALDAGADDYLRKPFAVGDLLLRVRLWSRHSDREALRPRTPLALLGRPAAASRSAPVVSITLLGGFRVSVGSEVTLCTG